MVEGYTVTWICLMNLEANLTAGRSAGANLINSWQNSLQPCGFCIVQVQVQVQVQGACEGGDKQAPVQDTM